MQRKIFNLCAAASLLSCMAVGVFWVRSHFAADSFSLETVQRFADHPIGAVDENVAYSLSSDAGTLIASRRRGTFGTPMPQLQLLPKRLGERRWTWVTAEPGAGRLRGFSTERVSFFHLGNLDAIDAWSVPYWLPALVFSALPCMWLIGRWRRAGMHA